MTKYPSFDKLRNLVEKQYTSVVYVPESGWSETQLRSAWEEHKKANPGEDRLSARAFLTALILRHAPIAEEKELPFAGKFQTFNLLAEDRNEGFELAAQKIPSLSAWGKDRELGIGWMVDLSHTAPDWKNVVTLGLPGLIRRARGKNSPFGKAVVTVYEALAEFCRRVGKLCGNPVYTRIADHAPQTLHEAFALALALHDAIEYAHMEVRTMGRFEEIYTEFFRRDLQSGVLTRESAKELIKFYFMTFYARYEGKRFGKNFCFGPEFNELSFLALETYYELNTVDPKLSVLVREDMPQEFLELYAKCIRDGRTGIVSLNYNVIVEGLIRHGRSPEDARNFIPIGCYEPAVAGKEISGSGTTHLYLPMILLHLLKKCHDFASFEDLKQGFFEQIRQNILIMQERQILCDMAWKYAVPEPLLSGTFDSCLEKERDITEAGALYNTTGCVVSYFADTVDSLEAIRYLVYENKLCTLPELVHICQENWKDHEELRQIALKRPGKWGNNDPRTDTLAQEIAAYVSKLLWTLPNGRGGSFFPSLYGQMVVENGKLCGALPSGRLAGEPMSKNMDAVTGMDRKGITALMNSVLKIDMRQFPCGTCLDIMLHPTSVAGEEGIKILASLIKTFIARGGSGLQFNIFDAAVLREAQKAPDKYENLQVRVCGWNSRFNDLTSEAQETFIKQAETLS